MSNSSLSNLYKIYQITGLDTLSIKKLTLLGFSLVALPLVMALLYSAAQINKLSNQSEDAIFNAAEFTETTKQLSELLVKMERYASQSIVLKNKELTNNYFIEEERLLNITNKNLINHTDKKLKEISNQFITEISIINQLLSPNNEQTLYLTQLQDQFKLLAKTYNRINQRSNELIYNQAKEVRTSASLVRQTMLNSLLIIPITILIAVFFIIIITKPLKKLIAEIQQLEQGNFEHQIALKSSPEINEIVDALEVMRTRLHALELQKSSFIRHISHELKTPLAAIREGTELLYDNSVGSLNPDQQEISDIIRTSVTRLQRLIEDLLDFNIVLDSTSLQDSEKLYVTQLIGSVINERKLDIKRKDIDLHTTFENIAIYSNAKQLAVILDNLLSNAIKYSPFNSRISISTSLSGEQLKITITDQGMGLNEEVINKVFDAFYQGPAPQGNEIKGSGLGLTIVKELLMRINGNISVTSKIQEPSGTTFTLILPRAFLVGTP
ncbi:HAMP domain-containing sensor histidine kinase [Pseudocolwellia sp. AS88]|uniref:sensor histidine kinase n=1 Tax=Pseudocolwellia sp. AS88 TaxID=3063958 RepID=UPI0026EFDB5A|nr:HAMP domain-containing sensor histidine kinase [Pseudocolwellia sp. AS88]MDO7085003.1 HAMP domain-containing sensor histidine kinase [Pseudocolwellia sp. AS88]